MKPQIIIDPSHAGYHNSNPETQARLKQAKSYKDQSTICIIPTRGMIPAKIVQSWWGLMSPMNQKFIRIFMVGMEVGEAYQNAIEQILSHPDLSKWKYILTLEEDNAIPPDGLIKLLENMDKYDAIGGLYYTKGIGGQPMCYGKPETMPRNFIPFPPKPNDLTECNGLGMGFTLFRMEMFKDPKLTKPWFKTEQKYTEGVGSSAFTQDLYFFNKARELGYKFACDSRVLVGHYDYENDMLW